MILDIGTVADKGLLSLSDAHFVLPGGMVAYLAAATSLIGTGEEVGYIRPTDPGVARYLQRMGFPRMMREAGANGPDTFAEIRPVPHPDQLCELQRLDGLDDDSASALASLVFERLQPTNDGIFDDVLELCLNVVEHSGTGGAVAAQVFEPESAKKARVEFAVGDWGRGIHNSLTGPGRQYESDEDAIVAALTTSASRKGPNGGRGLCSIREHARYIAANCGRQAVMTLWSGRSRVREHLGLNPSLYRFPAKHLAGTVVCVEIPLGRSPLS